MNFLEQFKDKSVYCVCDADLDGVMASLLCDYYIKPITSKYIRYNTGDRSLPDFNWDIVYLNFDFVIFVDLAPYSLEMYNKIKEHCNVQIFDHHESHKKYLGELPNYFYTTEKCATKILFDKLTEGQRVKKILYQFIELTNVYDIYQIESNLWRNAKGLNNLLYAYIDWRKANYQTDTQKHQRFIDAQLSKINNSNSKEFYFTAWEKEKALKAEEKERDNYKQAKKSLQIRTDNQGNKYGYFECSSKVSWTASLLLREYPDIKYFVCHSTFLEKYRHEENGKISLRSQKGFDVSIIAEKYNGGGHNQAAGLELPIEDFYKLREGKIHLI